jgi:putative ABC transport system permease protein
MFFAGLKHAALSLAERVADNPGVSAVETGIALRVTLDLPGMAEPASAQINSLPDRSEARLNRLYSRVGHMLGAGSQHEILVGEAFADAHRLKPGDALSAILNGCTVPLRVAGIGLRRSGRKKRPTLGDAYRVGVDLMLVPAGALFQRRGTWNIFTVENGRARLREVRVRRSDGTLTQILEGVKPDADVIVYPGDGITDGVRVAFGK